MIRLTFLFLLSFFVFSSLVGCTVGQSSDQDDTFSAFTATTRDPELKELEQLYQKLRNGEPHLHADPAMNVETKINVCKSITRSSYFDMLSYKYKSIDMDEVYPELKRYTIVQMQKAPSSDHRQHVYHKMMRQDYELKSLLRYTYRTEPVIFRLSTGERMDEYAFACTRRILHPTHKGANQLLILYYISDAYEISSGNSSEDQISVRLVCEVRHGECDLLGIAERPAIAFANPEYHLEDVYRRMREAYNAAQIASGDPLCQLTKLEKLRVCVVVMNSSYFIGKVKFHPDVIDFQDVCIHRVLSFRRQTPARGSGKSYSEWMLTCSVEPLVQDAHTEYFVSRAYQSHYVAIYSRQDAEGSEQWYLENISGNVGVVIERNLYSVRVESEGEFSHPNLKKLIEESKIRPSAKTSTSTVHIQSN